jgi:hypothetical protein
MAVRKGVIAVIIIVILICVGILAYFTGALGPVSLSIASFTPVFCDDYEFICCSEILGSEGSFYSDWTTVSVSYGMYTCPSYATSCEITTNHPYVFRTGSPTACSKSCIGSACTVNCPDFYNIGSGTHTLYGGQAAYFSDGPLGSNSPYRSGVQVSFREFQNKMYWTGAAGVPCGKGSLLPACGVPVTASNQCTYTGGQQIFDANGALTTNSLTTGQCKIVKKTAQKLCGQVESACTRVGDPSECIAGHSLTYNYNGKTYGAEAGTGHLSLYSCVETDVPNPTAQDEEIQNGQIVSTNPKVLRCESVLNVPVACTTPDSCAYGYTCQDFQCVPTQEAECAYDWDCGTFQRCDSVTKTITGPACVGGQCTTQDVRQVQCCWDTDCSAGYQCVDYQCKAAITPPQSCPYGCCEGQPGFLDRPCPEGQECCGSHTCAPIGQCQQGICDNDNRCESHLGETIDNCADCQKADCPEGAHFDEAKQVCVADTDWLPWVLLAVVVVVGGIIVFFMMKSKKKGGRRR